MTIIAHKRFFHKKKRLKEFKKIEKIKLEKNIHITYQTSQSGKRRNKIR